MEYIFLLVFGGVVIIGLSLFFEDYNKRIIFDKSIEVFHPAWEEIDEHNSNQDTIPLKSIHALQIIPEYIRNTKSRYYSYELNLVLRDGRRINVLDYGNLERVLEDAQILSEFLSVPVWDATKHCLQSEETQT